jgi:hypothetical protein
MKIVSITAIETCFDGSIIQEVILDKAINEDFILYLGKAGQLSYFKTFARPFYKIVFPTHFYIKGVEGNNSLRSHTWQETDLIILKDLINSYLC